MDYNSSILSVDLVDMCILQLYGTVSSLNLQLKIKDQKCVTEAQHGNLPQMN